MTDDTDPTAFSAKREANEHLSTDVDATSAFLGRAGARQRNADGWHQKRPFGATAPKEHRDDD